MKQKNNLINFTSLINKIKRNKHGRAPIATGPRGDFSGNTKNRIFILLFSICGLLLNLFISSSAMASKNSSKSNTSNNKNSNCMVATKNTADKTNKPETSSIPIDSNKNVEFTDAQKPIIVKKVSPIFIITLPSNPTTGYSWVLKNFNRNLVRPVKRAYVPPPSTKNSLIGKGGYESWKFAIKEDGFIVPQSTSITLIYSRPWESESAQVTNFTVITQP